MNPEDRSIQRAAAGLRLSAKQAYALVDSQANEQLTLAARELTEIGFGSIVTFSPKVFVPLTQLCRDVCHYCTFASTPKKTGRPYLSSDEVISIVQAGETAGCREALLTLGDKPEQRYQTARTALKKLGHDSTLSYLARIARLILDRSSLLPHLNPGVMNEEQIRKLKPFCASMGLMLESVAERLCQRGGPHYGSPDKHPATRLATLEAAGRASVPFTTGILVGIGETRFERIEALLAIRDVHERYGHIQEVIIQNFRAKPETKMSNSPELELNEHLWTIAVARLVLGPRMSIQCPPNLQSGNLTSLLHSGVNDWGGVSPVTPDHVNPEAPWPNIKFLETQTNNAGRELRERFAICPKFARDAERWLMPELAQRVRKDAGGDGCPREDNWFVGEAGTASQPIAPAILRANTKFSSPVARSLKRIRQRRELGVDDVAVLFSAVGQEEAALIHDADKRRQEIVGDKVTFVVNRNINYTNICGYKCQFCAFAKGSSRTARDPGYLMTLDEIACRSEQAWRRGATEVCLQGGIHPTFTGRSYLDILRAVKTTVPELHVHAFSPLEVMHGAQSLGLSIEKYMGMLAKAGLDTMPGTAAEILDDEIRRVICPDKLTTNEWLEVITTAHRAGIRSTATIMFGHIDGYEHWARHLLHIKALQDKTGGFTEFVPLPFVHMGAPIWRQQKSRRGPTYREVRLMHAVARLVFDQLIPNIQVSWSKLGVNRATDCLAAGVNDLGGTLMNESITRAAGGVHGQFLGLEDMEKMATMAGRTLGQRNTLYGRVEAASSTNAVSSTRPTLLTCRQ